MDNLVINLSSVMAKGGGGAVAEPPPPPQLESQCSKRTVIVDSK